MEPLIIALLIGIIWGGSLTNLSRLRFRLISFIIIAFLIQTGIDLWASRLPTGVSPFLHIISYLLLLVALLKNKAVPGVPLMAAGTILNFLVILFNGGQMPVNAAIMPGAVLNTSGLDLGGTHGLMQGPARLSFLADVIPLPVFYHPRLVSLGDIVLNLGLIVLIVKGMKSGNSRVDQTP